MAVDTAYTTEAQILKVVGQLGIDLRLDDSVDRDGDVLYAVETGTDELDFYLQRYAIASIAASDWANKHATWFAIRALCQRRLNDIPETVKLECERREKQLQGILDGKYHAPRLANTRRPAAVTGYTTDPRRFNNKIRVDRSRSTGLAEGYQRPTDDTAPDDR